MYAYRLFLLKAGKVVEKSDQGAEKESSDSEGGKKVRQHSSGRLGKVQATAIKRRKGGSCCSGRRCMHTRCAPIRGQRSQSHAQVFRQLAH